MIAVLSFYRPRLEDYLAARGERIIAVIPEGSSPRRESDPGYPVKTIGRWDDYDRLLALAGEFGRLGVTAVATIDEPCVRAAAFLREVLGLPGQGFDSAIACTDKAVMKARLEAAGIPVAQHRIVRTVRQIREFLEEVDADIVVKPRTGFACINTHRVNRSNVERLVAEGAFAAPGNLPGCFGSTDMTSEIGQAGYLAERYIDLAAEYHCEVLIHEGSEIHCVAGRYASPLLSGGSMGAVFLEPGCPEAVKVGELTRAAVAALGMSHGFGHCEVFRDRSGGWLVGEFGARPGGALVPRALQLTYGIDNLALMADQLAGREPVTSAQPIGGPVAWRLIPVAATESDLVAEVPSIADLLDSPDVLEARVVARPGDCSDGSLGPILGTAYVVCTGATPDDAERSAESVVRACRSVAEAAA